MGRPRKQKPETDLSKILETIVNEPETANTIESQTLENKETGLPESKETGTDTGNAEPLRTITDADIDNALAGFTKSAETVEQKKERKTRTTNEPALIIPGSLVVSITDKIMVGGFTAIDGVINKKNRIARDVIKSYLSLSPEQQKELAPLAEAFVKALNLEKDPIKLYLYSMIAIYSANYLALRAFMSETVKPK